MFSEERIEYTDHAQTADERLGPDYLVFVPEDEAEVIGPGFLVAAAATSLPVAEVGEEAVLHCSPIPKTFRERQDGDDQRRGEDP